MFSEVYKLRGKNCGERESQDGEEEEGGFTQQGLLRQETWAKPTAKQVSLNVSTREPCVHTNREAAIAVGSLEKLRRKSCLLASDFLDDVESKPFVNCRVLMHPAV